MSPRQWLALLCFYTIYLFFGASIFYHIEHDYEMERRAEELGARIVINELLTKYTSPEDLDIQNYVLKEVSSYCKKPVTNHTLDEFVDPYQWDFYHSVFFAFTVCSTLGYGNIAPTHTLGQYFMIVYALIGIPVNGILYAYLGEFFGKTFVSAYNRYKSYKITQSKTYAPHHLGMIAQIMLHLIPASVLLVFLPSCLFTYFEGWPYSVSVYYSFVTLSTIGFGDFIPTFQPHQERVFGISFKFYQAFVIIWFVFGLSYLLMLIGFIATGMRSKRILRLEQQLSDNIRLTHNRIWGGVTKDVSYLRRILNEVQMMKLKTTYIDTPKRAIDNLPKRSASCPNFTLYHTCGDIPKSKRKRAVSMYCEWRIRHSDTDLNRMEIKRALDDGPVINTSFVLAKVVEALGNIQTTSSSSTRNIGSSLYAFGSQIAAEESLKTSQRTSAHGSIAAISPMHPRSRAVSGYQTSLTVPLSDGQSNGDWPWNGRKNSIHYDGHKRRSTGKFTDVHFITGRGDSENSSVSLNIEDGVKSIGHQSSANESFLSKINPFKKKSSDEEEILKDVCDSDKIIYSGLRKSSLRRDSKVSLVKQSMRRQSTLPKIESEENILENTTLADLIRALAVAHTQEVLEPNSTLDDIPSIIPTNKRSGERRKSMFPIRRNESFHMKSKRRQSLSHNPEPVPENFLLKYESLFGLMDSPDEKETHTFSEDYLLKYDSPFGLMDTPLERKLNAVPKPPGEIHRKFSLFPTSLLGGGETSVKSLFSRRSSQQCGGVLNEGNQQPSALMTAKNITWNQELKESSNDCSETSQSDLKSNQ